MSQAGNFLENKIAAKLFSGVDFTVSNWYAELVNVPIGTVVEDQTTPTLYSYALDPATHGGYTGRFEILWNVIDNLIVNTNTSQWTATAAWASVPSHVFMYDSQNASSGDLLFYAQIPGLPGTILIDDVLKLKPSRITITID